MIPRIPLQPADQSEFCRARLSLGSVVKLTSLLGLGYGIACLFIAFLLALLGVEKYARMSITETLLLCALGPFAGTLQGAMMGLLGYPLYGFLMKRRDGQTLKGSFTTLRIGPMPKFGQEGKTT